MSTSHSIRHQFPAFGRVLFGLIAFFCGAACAHLGGGLTSSVGASPDKYQIADDADAEFDGFEIAKSAGSVRFTVTDPGRTFIVFGVGTGSEGIELPTEDSLVLQTSLVGTSTKTQADQPSRIYELIARADCPEGDGPCLPCQFSNCTGPMPPPGPEPIWLEGLWLNDHMRRPWENP